MISSRTFMVLWIIFKSFIHLDFIPVYAVYWSSSFIFLYVRSSSPNIICWTGYFYSIVCSYTLCKIWIDHWDLGLLLGSLFCYIDQCFASYASTRLLWLQWPCSIVWYQVLWSLILCSSSPRLLWLFGVIVCYIKTIGIFVLDLWNRPLLFFYFIFSFNNFLLF